MHINKIFDTVTLRVVVEGCLVNIISDQEDALYFAQYEL